MGPQWLAEAAREVAKAVVQEPDVKEAAKAHRVLGLTRDGWNAFGNIHIESKIF